MLTVDYKKTLGEIKYIQASDNKVYTIHIHGCNALCAFIYHYKDESGTKMAQLVSFFADEQHVKNCEKSWGGDCLAFLLLGKVKSVKLNLYYKESNVLLKHIVKQHEVKCYYKKEK